MLDLDSEQRMVGDFVQKKNKSSAKPSLCVCVFAKQKNKKQKTKTKKGGGEGRGPEGGLNGVHAEQSGFRIK